MSSEAWAIVAATALGPVFAVAVSLWREAFREKRNRQLQVFRSLMATRRQPISSEHVNAINLVEVDFYKCTKVEAAWNIYKNHLNDNTKPEDQDWREKKEQLLAKLLYEIATVLDFNIPAIDLFKGGYAPRGWEHRDARALGALEFVHDLSVGSKFLPVVAFAAPPTQPAPPKTLDPDASP
jgi:hypothetical protein